MINNKNIYEDLKIMFLPSGYVTEDECCGYDEIIFAVRKTWLQAWFDKYIKSEESDTLQEWLEDYYTEDDANSVYLEAKDQKELVFKKKIWNNRIHYYEVYEDVTDNLEKETNVFIRTMDLQKAIKCFRKEKEKIIKDENFFLNYRPNTNYEDFSNGEAQLNYDDYEQCRFYSLCLTEREIEQ